MFHNNNKKINNVLELISENLSKFLLAKLVKKCCFVRRRNPKLIKSNKEFSFLVAGLQNKKNKKIDNKNNNKK